MKKSCEEKQILPAARVVRSTGLSALTSQVLVVGLFFLLAPSSQATVPEPRSRNASVIVPELGRRDPRPVIVHHSDSDRMTLAQCNEWHKARGWDSCGYNFIIQRDGTIDTSRGWNKTGAHCKGFNSLYLGVCFVGKDYATEAQIEAFRKMFHGQRFYGHKDFRKTECPGKMLEQLKEEMSAK